MSDKMPDSASNPEPKPTVDLATRVRNFLIVFVAIVLSTAIFLGLQTETGSASLSAMAETATPLEVAVANGKPTLMEFYADWCTSCQAMAGDMNLLKEQYGDRVNFVMLNVDNSKWLPEMLRYHVDGIPHFVFINGQGEAIASSIGEQPRTIMAANLDALALDSTLPYIQTNGQFSKVDPVATPQPRNDDPRGHGQQSSDPSQ